MPRVDVFENDCVHNFTKLTKVFFELFVCQFEVETTYKNLRLRISEFDRVFSVQRAIRQLFLFTKNVRIRLLDLLTLLCHDDLVSLVRLQRGLVSTFLIIIGGFHVDALLHNEVPRLSILLQNPLFGIDGSLFIDKADENEAETATSSGCFVAHNNRVFHFAVLFEVGQ